MLFYMHTKLWNHFCIIFKTLEGVIELQTTALSNLQSSFLKYSWFLKLHNVATAMVLY